MVLPVVPRTAIEYKTEPDSKTSPFSEWLISIADARTRAKITKAITQMEAGNFGDNKPVGDGLRERKLDFGPGYRIYYLQEGDRFIVIFAGSDKSDQQLTINKAKEYLKDYTKRKPKESLTPKAKSKNKRKHKK